MVNADPASEQKRFLVHLPASLEQLVEDRVVNDLALVDVLRENQREHREHREYRGVAEHQPPVVYLDAGELEASGKDELNDTDYESSVDDEVRQQGRAHVAKTPVPQKQFPDRSELSDAEV